MRQEAVKSLNLIYFPVSGATGSTKSNAVISVELISFNVACCPLIKWKQLTSSAHQISWVAFHFHTLLILCAWIRVCLPHISRQESSRDSSLPFHPGHSHQSATPILSLTWDSSTPCLVVLFLSAFSPLWFIFQFFITLNSSSLNKCQCWFMLPEDYFSGLYFCTAVW